MKKSLGIIAILGVIGLIFWRPLSIILGFFVTNAPYFKNGFYSWFWMLGMEETFGWKEIPSGEGEMGAEFLVFLGGVVMVALSITFLVYLKKLFMYLWERYIE